MQVQMVDSDVEHYLQELQMSLINKHIKHSNTLSLRKQGQKSKNSYKLPYYQIEYVSGQLCKI